MLLFQNFAAAVTILSAASSSALAVKAKGGLPVVDLGYTIHRAQAYNSSTDILQFANIRYAQAPTGELRFRAPLPPLENRSVIEDGSKYRACPQGMPMWQANAYIPIGKYSGSAPFSLPAWKHDIATSRPPPGLLETMNDNVSEDCLFLDVHVRKENFELANSANPKKKAAPVLVWIHGGGYVLGSKTGHPTPYMNPDGLIAEARTEGGESLVFVGINYRLGALGFLAGPEVVADGTLNAGLLDQRLALDWVQKNIHKFGGDPKRVTVMGESAGGGSLLYHMAAYGGQNGSSPFSQVIVQSPATLPRGVAVEGSYTDFLKTLGADSLAQARQMTEKQIIRANEAQIGAAPATTYIYGPVVDGLIVPGEVGDTFTSGAFDHSVEVLAAHNSFEGGFFYDPKVTTEDEFRAWIPRSLAGLSSSDVEHLARDLYPPQFDGSLGYVDQETRQMALFGEAIIECSFLLANKALNGKSYAYEFSVSPGLHVQDTRYTFDDYNSAVRDPKAKQLLQRVLATFVVKGKPQLREYPEIGDYLPWGAQGTLLNITGTGGELSSSRVNETRCAWWHGLQESKYQS